MALPASASTARPPPPTPPAAGGKSREASHVRFERGLHGPARVIETDFFKEAWHESRVPRLQCGAVCPSSIAASVDRGRWRQSGARRSGQCPGYTNGEPQSSAALRLAAPPALAAAGPEMRVSWRDPAMIP